MDPATMAAILSAAGGITQGGANAVANDTYGKGNFLKGASTGIPILGPLFQMAYQKDLDEKSEEEQKLTEASLNQTATQRYFAKGGLVKGPGTGKSDSIKTKLPVGSFVVPVENSDLGMAIGKAVLGWKDGQQLKTGGKVTGKSVAISNNEVVYSPEERKVLMAKGIDISMLAPNAKEGFQKKSGGLIKELKYADGGDVDGDEVKTAIDKKDYKAISIPNDPRFNYDMETGRLVAKNGSYSVDKDGNVYKPDGSLWSVPDSKGNFPSSDRKGLSKDLEKTFNAGETIAKQQGYIKDNDGKITRQNNFNYDKNEQRQFDKEFYIQNAKVRADNSPSLTADVKQNFRNAKNITDEEKSVIRDLYAEDPDAFDLNEVYDALKTEENKGDDKTAAKGDPKNDTGNKSKMSLATGISAAQAGLGLASSLALMGKEPEEYKPSGELQDAFARATSAAQYGLTPLERSEMEKDIEAGRRVSSSNIRQASGGSAGTSLAGELAVSLNANKAYLGVQQYDKQLQMQKQMYADNFIVPILTEKQFAYTDKMNRYNQKVAASANLLNAGIHNVVGSLRYGEQVGVEEKIAGMYNQPIVG